MHRRFDLLAVHVPGEAIQRAFLRPRVVLQPALNHARDRALCRTHRAVQQEDPTFGTEPARSRADRLYELIKRFVEAEDRIAPTIQRGRRINSSAAARRLDSTPQSRSTRSCRSCAATHFERPQGFARRARDSPGRNLPTPNWRKRLVVRNRGEGQRGAGWNRSFREGVHRRVGRLRSLTCRLFRRIPWSAEHTRIWVGISTGPNLGTGLATSRYSPRPKYPATKYLCRRGKWEKPAPRLICCPAMSASQESQLRPRVPIVSTLAACLLAASALSCAHSAAPSADSPFDADRAWHHLETVVGYGVRSC